MKIYDLSYEIYCGMPVFPGTPPVDMKVSHTIEKDNYILGQAILNTHAGTHTDAPKHFLPEAPGLEGININAYIGNALIVNCSGKKAKEAITVDDMKPYAQRIINGSRIIIKTGWSKFYKDKSYYTDYPVISLELAKWVVERGVILLGVEPPSLNPAQYIEVHQTLLKGGVAIIEGLTNLEQLESDEIFFVGLPICFKGADGFPVRAIGIDFSINSL